MLVVASREVLAHVTAAGFLTQRGGIRQGPPEMQEVPPETVARSYLVVDAVDAAMAEAGDLLKAIDAGFLSRDAVRVELGHVVNGSAERRSNPEQVTFFKSVGNAVQDVIVARYAVTAAEQSGRGQTITL